MGSNEDRNGDLTRLILSEVAILEKIVGEINAISMHRPSKETLESNISIPGVANSYSKKFFSEFKYISDSRMVWREDPIEVITSGKYDRIQILTHPFWYFETERSMKKIIGDFIACQGAYLSDRYNTFNNNFTGLSNVFCNKVRNNLQER